MAMVTRANIRPRVKLALDRNIFGMVDKCIAEANKTGMAPADIDAFRRQVFTSSDYAEAYRIICDWFEVEPLI